MTGRDGATLIRAAAERLIAERGVDVPLRDIAVAANQRNNSAVQYHFGTRDRLITSIVEEGNAAPEARRLELLAEAESERGGDEVRSLVELIVRPIAEIPYAGGSTHYARFLEQVRNHPAVLGAATHWTLESPAMRIIMARLDRALATVQSPALRRMRLTSMATAMFALLANRERELEAGDLDAAAAEAATANIIDVLTGMLLADPSLAVLTQT